MFCTAPPMGRGRDYSIFVHCEAPTFSICVWSECCVTDLLYQAALYFPSSWLFVCLMWKYFVVLSKMSIYLRVLPKPK